jgi:hypothetical protein
MKQIVADKRQAKRREKEKNGNKSLSVVGNVSFMLLTFHKRERAKEKIIKKFPPSPCHLK